VSPGLSHFELRVDAVAVPSIHKLHIFFGDVEVAFRDLKMSLCPAQLHVALRQFGDRRERDAMPVLHGRQSVSVGCFHGPPNATE
jgi:hypothetical protein